MCTIALTGCGGSTPEEREQTRKILQEIDDKNRRDDLHTVDYNGHSYIIYQGRYKGGITHDPDCPCRWLSTESHCVTKKGGNDE